MILYRIQLCFDSSSFLFTVPAEAKKAAEVLGYTKKIWDSSSGSTAADEKEWDELTPMEKEAAKVLGWTESTWDDEE
jgi:hypothetical protein